MKRVVLLALLVLSAAFVALWSRSEKNEQNHLIQGTIVCDYRCFASKCLTEARPYRPVRIKAHDACYPALAYLGLKAFPLTPTGEVAMIAVMFLVLGGGLALFLHRRTSLPVSLALAAVSLTTAFVAGPLRGNPSAWAVGLVLAFLALYDHPRRSLRSAAAVALGLAVALKLSPAVFGVVYLVSSPRTPRQWPWADILLAAGVFTLAFVMPFGGFGGFSEIGTWWQNAVANMNYYSCYDPMWGLSELSQRFASLRPFEEFAICVTRALALVCVIAALCAGSFRGAMLPLGAAMLFLTHHDYGLAYMLPAFFVWLDGLEEPVRGLRALLAAVLWLVILSPLQIPAPDGIGTLNPALENEAVLILLALDLADVANWRKRP